ncbi:MAG TPA: 16S rRNA (cytosine(1402)-N(4))-methyltransferase RsmH [Candidatus Limnocylindrales bacterium]|nr:16S rRNA (cytosine(1402)-N(4))-methyltransferase RsmH [Candidatus Limnocylindrales bacterium]
MTQDNIREDSLHVPVLLHEVLDVLRPLAGERYLDLTAGYGGHAARILERTGSTEHSVLVDRDENAVRELRARFGPNVRILHQDFFSATEQLEAAGEQFDLILADLGVSSPHLNDAHRGFSLTQDGPLDMRMDPRQELTAERIVNTYSELDLIDILKRYGEEPKARTIARTIVTSRPLRSTTALADVIRRAWRGHSKVHPATRTFQAIRIAVNDELGLLQESLPKWINLLTPGGRIAIVSFQSLEDRLVKQTLAEHSGDRYDADLQILTKRPITASHDELVHNPRARSAKLRAAVKINKSK